MIGLELDQEIEKSFFFAGMNLFILKKSYMNSISTIILVVIAGQQ